MSGSKPGSPWSRRVLWAAAALAFGSALVLAHSVLLLAFAAILFGVFLRGAGDWLARWMRLHRNAALTLVIILLLGSVALLVSALRPQVSEQLEQLSSELPAELERLEMALERHRLGRMVLDWIHGADEGDQPLLEQATSAVSRTLGGLANALLIFFIGIYLAAESQRYTEGLVTLLPPSRRPRGQQVLDACAHVLRGWVLGQMVSMTVLGVFSYIGLRLLGIPLALVLALFTAALTFIPYLGPLLSVIPPLMLALAQSPITALWVGLFYLVLQNVEGYLITPLVQRQAARLPPALMLFTQILLLVLFGFFGVLVAAPLLAATMVLVRMVYVEDVLGDRPADAAAKT